MNTNAFLDRSMILSILGTFIGTGGLVLTCLTLRLAYKNAKEERRSGDASVCFLTGQTAKLENNFSGLQVDPTVPLLRYRLIMRSWLILK